MFSYVQYNINNINYIKAPSAQLTYNYSCLSFKISANLSLNQSEMESFHSGHGSDEILGTQRFEP